ncbi:DUF3120 domain-containing protein [Synechococcus sp. CCY9202]|nr:DUF3120 domain-containing protein [Synechococcus sp. CCY9202]
MIGVPSSLQSPSGVGPLSLIPLLRSLERPEPRRPGLASIQAMSAPWLAALLVSLPVFLQAPWVRVAPASSALFTGVLLLVGLVLERQAQERSSQAGALLVGFSGSWLAGSLFWGWCRLHPLWHLPIEAFALPLALTGLAGRWRLACAFYLGSLLGTAATDAVMALTGVMAHWTIVLQASPEQAPLLLQDAARQVLQPLPLFTVLLAAVAIGLLCRQIWQRGTAWRVAASSLLTTLVVDGLFLLAALLAPHVSGLV